MKWIKWVRYFDGDVVGRGQMPLSDVNNTLVEWGKVASDELKETGVDHIVYGMKCYNVDNELEELHLYDKCYMDDYKFDRVMKNVVMATVYAVHKK